MTGSTAHPATEALLDRVRTSRVNGVAIGPGDDFRYLIGFSPTPDERPCYLLAGRRGAAMVMPSLNAGQVADHTSLPMFSYADADGPGVALDRAAEAAGVPSTCNRLAVGDSMRADALLVLLEKWPAMRPESASSLVGGLRARKSDAELARLQAAADLADQAMAAAFSVCRPGVTERDIADAAIAVFREGGAEEVCHTIVASGPNSAYPHHHTAARRLEPGNPVTIDIGCRVEGYCSDITRMAVLGDASMEYEQVHAVVEDAVKAAMAAVRPGVACAAVDEAARTAIERAGYGEYFTHRTGHGIGLSVHERPYVTGTNRELLEPGMVFSIEPGIYLPGRFGVRLEEIVVVTPTGCRRLSHLPRDAFFAR
ncbi:MAG TPA: Xaa-Pro peptidase family protein [Bacillota bacterium]|nr:Xaa-Pro peptidase family protein [Bacillota bacterium]